MSNRTDPPTQEELPTTGESTADDQSSLKSPVRPVLVGSGMFLPGLIMFAVALVVILYFVFR